MIAKDRIAILVGMPRAATTFLYHNLGLHPEIFIPYRRKTNYFSLHHNKGEDWFLSHFKNAPEKAIAIDTETLAFINSGLNSPQVIKAFNGKTKIILCVRDPASYAVSLYHQIATFDKETPRFENFLAGTYTLQEDGIETSFHMNDGDIYARVREYEQLFSNSLLLLNFREVTAFPLESLRKIEAFLGISSFYNAANIITKKINSRGRRHNRWLNALLRNVHVITLVRVLVPRKAVLAIRWIFDGLLAEETPGFKIPVADEEEIKMLSLARNHFRSDLEALKDYFQ